MSVTVLVPLLVIVLIVVLLGLFIVSVYNRLVGLRNRYKNAFSQIDVQLKRRYDLIPNLVETAKGYLTHERETLDAVISARNQAFDASKKAAQNPGESNVMRGLQTAETGLGGALSRLMAVVENYPNLKADQTMLRLSEELTSTENKISFARQAYNDSVMTFNTTRETFPNNIVAGTFGFLSAELFDLSNPAEREAPKVSFQ